MTYLKKMESFLMVINIDQIRLHLTMRHDFDMGQSQI